MLKYRKINENSNNTQIAYHTTNSGFNEFDSSFIKRFDYGKGFYFTVNKAYAENYGKYLLTCEIPEDKYFLDLDIAWDNDNNYIQEALVELWLSIKNVEDKLKFEKVMFRDYCNTGWWIYNALTEIYDTTEQVQDLLYQYGIKGLYSFDGDCYIVFKKEDIKILNRQRIKESYKNKIFYHGSNQKFDAFDKSKIKENKLGLVFNFTDDINIAYQYGDNIINAHLDLNNPLMLDIWDNIFPFKWFNKFGKLFINEPDYEYNKEEYEKHPYTFGEMYNTYKMEPEFIQILEEMGYDGIAIPEDHHFGVFEPEQIHIIKNFNELSMYKSNLRTFKDFYHYVLTNPNCKKCYFEFSNKLRISSDTILHDYNKHDITLQNWEDCFNNLNNIIKIDISKKKLYSSKANIFLIHIKGYNDYGLTLQTEKCYNQITTLFLDHPNTIDNWIKNGGVGALTSQLLASDTSKSSSVTLSNHPPINIINQNLNNLNPYNKKSLQNEKLEKAEIQYGYLTIDTIISFDPSNYELQGLLNKYKALRVLVAQEPGSGKLQLICMSAASGDHGLLATWLMKQGYKIFRKSFYHIVNSEKGPFLTLDSFYKNSEDLKYELLDELNSIYDNQELINKMLDEYYMLKELLPSIVNTEAIDYAVGEFE